MQDHEEDTEAFCSECKEDFDTSAFDYVDDEFDPEDPMCPDCKREKRIAGATCENGDGRPAAHEVEMGLLCEDCFEHYADGYSRE